MQSTPYYGPQAPRSMLFAGTVLGLIGAANCIQGIAALANNKTFADSAIVGLGNVRVWGWIVLIAGLAQLVASFAIFSKSSLARWFGVATAAGNAFVQLIVFPEHPFWSMCAFAANMVVIRVLVVHGGRGWANR